jgi:predicted dehydrogenase
VIEAIAVLLQIMSLNKKIKVAIVGCGAIAELGHLPSLARSSDAVAAVLVDPNLKRAQELANSFNVSKVQETTDGLEKEVDAVIIATPPSSHAEIATDLMRRGCDVLIEKPLANSLMECEQIAEVAEKTGQVCAVGMLRRFYWADQHIKWLVKEEVYGPLKSFTAENGYPFRWPSASRFILTKKEAGGGVLMGLGSHMLDTLFWWLGEPADFSFKSDAHGGMDSESFLQMTMPGGTTGTLELSRSRQLANCYILEFEKAQVMLPLYGNKLEVRLHGSPVALRETVVPAAQPDAETNDLQPMCDQLADFMQAIRNRCNPMSTVQEVSLSIAFIEACYREAHYWPLEWIKPIELPV